MVDIIDGFISYATKQKSLSPSYQFILHILLEKKDVKITKRSDLIKEQVRSINPSVFDINDYKYELSIGKGKDGKLSSKSIDYSKCKIESIQIKNFRGFGPFSDN